jgi:alpha-1,3-rhamnosyl/mannosyltransferase
MKIVLDCRSVFEGMGGIGRATACLARELPRALEGHELILLFGARRPKESLVPGVEEITAEAAMIDPEFEQIRLPALIEELKADVYHGTCFAVPIAAGGAKTVATVHDVVFRRRPELVEPKLRRYLDRWTTVSCEYADVVLTDSEYSRKEILELYGREARVIPLAVSPEFFEIQRTPLPGPPFLLYVGSIEPKKNVQQLVNGFEAFCNESDGAAHHLVLVGGVTALPEIPKKIADRVHVLGHVPDEHLKKLYGGAAAFAYLSEYEGFGLPPLEAMAAGVPTIVANRTTLPEVTDGAATLVEPDDSESVARALAEALLVTDELRVERGRKAARRYRWEESAEKLASLYQELTKPSLKLHVGGAA